MRTWKVLLAYDGTDYHGWQIQPGRRTVQAELSAAIERVCGEQVLPQGSGRTDAGVHALEQVASVQLSAPIPETSLVHALNRTLPPSIRILTAEVASDQFHARHSCTRKTYEYRIFRGELCPPWLARYVYAYARPLDLEKMRRAAAVILGEHDFTSFAASDPDMKSRHAQIATTAANTAGTEGRGACRTIFESDWQWRRLDGSPPTLEGHSLSNGDSTNPSGGLLVYRVCGSGFLHHMVRNLVGTFLEVGRGKIAAEEIPIILDAHSRKLAGPTAPARGLFLSKVFY